MFSFLKKWSDSATEHKALQNDLVSIFARQGVNFMHLHPEITRCLMGLARTEGAERAVQMIDELMEQVMSQPTKISPEDASQALIDTCRSMNELTKR